MVATNLRPYMAALLLEVFYKAGHAILVPKKRNMMKLIKKKSMTFLANEGATLCKYSTLARDYC